MKAILASLLISTLFGAGLAFAGMTQPTVVLGFLDLAGAFNPALIFVMGTALLVTMIGYKLVWRGSRPLLAGRFTLPTATAIDKPLLAGAVLFGVGWGLAGYCPGPALASLSSGDTGVLLFVAAMALGLAIARMLASKNLPFGAPTGQSANAPAE